MNPPIRTLVVDDEPLARRAMRTLLAQDARIEYIGEARDGAEAIAAIETLAPELIFLDIRLPGCSGLDVLARTGTTAQVIFTTAHEDYALAAFELGAIDYLRKPFGAERLQRAVTRAAPQVQAARDAEGAGVPLTERLAYAGEPQAPRRRIFVRTGGTVIPIPCESIVRCESDGDYVIVHANGTAYPVYLNLGELAEQLDPERFIRVHRSHLVNLDHVASLSPHDPTRLAVHLKDGSTVVASRTGTQLLRRRYR